jgi:hypothetical protein
LTAYSLARNNLVSFTLLSLVVIFTQSIQLSKIVERIALLRVAIAPLGGLSIPAQGSTSTSVEAQPQADFA